MYARQSQRLHALHCRSKFCTFVNPLSSVVSFIPESRSCSVTVNPFLVVQRGQSRVKVEFVLLYSNSARSYVSIPSTSTSPDRTLKLCNAVS